MKRPLSQAIAGSLVLLVIPAACAVAAVSSHLAGGPGWLAPNYDVEYNYLLNGLRFEQGIPIVFFIQPATTLALLYAAIIHVSHAVAPVGAADVVEDVWRHPEAYVGRVHASLVVLLLCASFAAGVLVWRRTRSLPAGVAVQTGLILLTALAQSAGLIWPETLLAVVGVLFAGTLTLFVLDDCSSPRLCVALGVLGALGIASKVTFAVVALAPALLPRSRRHSMLYVAVLAGSTAVLLAPIAGRIPHLVGFLGGFAARSGSYGTGATGFGVREYLRGVILLVRQNKIPALLLLLSAGAFFAFRRSAALQDAQRSELRALGVVTLVELLLYGVVARQPYVRYLIPAVTLMGVNLVIIQRIGLSVWHQRRRTVQAFLMLGLAVLLSVWVRNTRSALASTKSDAAEHWATVEAAANLQKSGAVMVLGSWASSPAYALAIGQFWVGDAWGKVGEELYPGQLFLSGEGYLKTWNQGLGAGWEWPNINPVLSRAAEDVEWERVVALLKGHRVIAQGDWENIAPSLRRNPRISIQVIHRSRLESLVELRLR